MFAVRGAAVLLTFAATLLLARCGGVGESGGSSCSLCGEMNDISGSIAPQNGTQSQMRGWVVASFERDTGIARAYEVDNAGLFQLRQVRTDVPQTFALLSPDYILQAVLSIPGPIENTISQFIKIKSQYLPRFIHKGLIITLQDDVGISVTKDLAADLDGDGVPEGMLPIAGIDAALHGGGFGVQGFDVAPRHDMLALQDPAAASLDQDLDGNPNETDPDIDGDGVINWLDTDDNGNGILDIFDGDANGDLQNDAEPGQNDIDLYFKEGIEFLTVQFELKPKADGSGNQTSLAFKVKVRDNVQPIAVQVRGAPSLLNGATYTQTDNTGVEQVTAFNRLLADDGLSEDSNPGDRLFGRRVLLDKAKAPRAYEVVFIQLVFGTEANPWYMEFPYVFPDLKPAMISARYEPNTKNVLLIGNPFGVIQDFVWQIMVFDEEDMTKPVWYSPTVLGTDRQYEIPDNIMDPDKTYKYSVSAQVLDKIPGYPSYSIYSPQYDLQ